jgi:hypothetical protein
MSMEGFIIVWDPSPYEEQNEYIHEEQNEYMEGGCDHTSFFV